MASLQDALAERERDANSAAAALRKAQREHRVALDTAAADAAVALGRAQSRALDERSEATAREAQLQVRYCESSLSTFWLYDVLNAH